MKKALWLFLICLSLASSSWGAAITDKSIGGITAVIDPWSITNVATHAQLLAAQDDDVIIVTAIITLEAEVTIGSGSILRFVPGTYITLGAFDLIFNGILDAERIQVFNENSTGIVSFSATSQRGAIYSEWWGAKADGSVNCAAAIQSAVDSLPQVACAGVQSMCSGGRILFGQGTYNIGSGITIAGGGIYFEGQGRFATIIKATADVIMFQFTDSGGDGTNQFGGISNLALENFEDYDSYCIAVEEATCTGTDDHKEGSQTFENLHLWNGGILIAKSDAVTVRDVKIYQPTIGIHIYGIIDGARAGCVSMNHVIDHVDINDASSYGVYVEGMVDVTTFSDVNIWYSGNIGLYVYNPIAYGAYYNTLTFERCTVLNDDPAPTAGFKFDGYGRVRLQNCHAETSDLDAEAGFHIAGQAMSVTMIDCWAQYFVKNYYIYNANDAHLYNSTSAYPGTNHFYLESLNEFSQRNSFTNCKVIKDAGDAEVGFTITDAGTGGVYGTVFIGNSGTELTADMYDLSDDPYVIIIGNLLPDTAESLTSFPNDVGIGTILPQSLLDVQGDAGAAGIVTIATKELTVVDGDELGRINFNAPLESDGTDAILPGASIWAEAEGTFGAASNATSLVLATGSSEAAAAKLTIDSSGDVGIGTTVPPIMGLAGTTFLTVFETTEDQRAVVEIAGWTDNDDQVLGSLWFSNDDNASSSTMDGTSKLVAAIQSACITTDANAGTDSGGELSFWTKPESGAIAKAMTIDSAGNVGIGIATPATLLDINADSVRVRTAQTPASNAACTQGEIAWDANYVYVCTANTVWKRAALTGGY